MRLDCVSRDAEGNEIHDYDVYAIFDKNCNILNVFPISHVKDSNGTIVPWNRYLFTKDTKAIDLYNIQNGIFTQPKPGNAFY